MMAERERKSGRVEKVFICDVCGDEVDDEDDVCLLRNVYMLPENPKVYHVHRTCADRFEKHHKGRWERFSVRSQEANWFLPLMGTSTRRVH